MAGTSRISKLGSATADTYKGIAGLFSKGKDSLTPEQMNKVSKRLSMDSFNPKRVLAAMKDNPIMTYLIASDIYGAASPILEMMAAENPEVAAIVEHTEPVSTVAATSSVADINEFTDEFANIRTAVAFFGSFERYQEIKRAMTFPAEVDALYIQFRTMARGLRL